MSWSGFSDIVIVMVEQLPPHTILPGVFWSSTSERCSALTSGRRSGTSASHRWSFALLKTWMPRSASDDSMGPALPPLMALKTRSTSRSSLVVLMTVSRSASGISWSSTHDAASL